MPASPAMTVHSHRDIDADTGIIDTLDGLLVESISFKVATNRVDYAGGKNQLQVSIWNRKVLTGSVSAKVLKRAGKFGHKHPGTAIHPTYLTEFHSGVSLGFTAGAGDYFIYLPESSDPQKGEYDNHSFGLELWQDAADSVDVVAAPSYP